MPRLQPTLDYERPLWAQGVRRLAAVDECGAGPLAGAVMACALVLDPAGALAQDEAPRGDWPRIADSKQLSPQRVAETAAWAMSAAGRAAGVLGWAIGAASPREIDRLNIRGARGLAMDRALDRLARQLGPLDHVVIDGTPLPMRHPHVAVVGGDARIRTMALASIIAKWVRDDRHMARLAQRHPAFGWDRNAGYGVPVHLEALAAHGPTPHHRQTFAPVRRATRPRP